MERFRDFDLLNAPLEGTSLIEASAGTGKSYSIAGLFLRLVVEKHIPVHEILVVTFTQAATEELRDRIRNTLRGALETFSGGGGCKETFLEGLAARGSDHREAAGLLNAALRDFDRAAIMTIHGFCWRVLRENAFESLTLFDLELVSSQESFKSEIVDDFWRKHLYAESILFVQFALQNGFRPASLLSLLGNRISRPFLKVIPAVEPVDASPEERAFISGLERLQSAYPSVRDEVGDALRNGVGLKKSCYSEGKIPVWLAGLDELLSSPQPAVMLFPGFEKFTTSELCKSAKKGCAAPSHPFFDLCEELHLAQKGLLRAYERKLLGLRAGLFGFATAQLPGRKRERNVLYYDDLLVNLFAALKGKAGEPLARAVYLKYRAVLIDEFQDTDPLQYAIFNEVFARRPGSVFLIGDPKQSIYGFRGADLFAYMGAAREVQTRFTLRENWRSAPGLIAAINLLFENHPRPFVYEEIRYHPSLPAPGGTAPVLTIDSQTQPPFHLWLMDPGDLDPAKGIPKQEAKKAISEAVAGEIARLIRLGREGRAMLGSKPLGEGDIAVLVRKNQEGAMMQQVLSSFRIPSVLYSTGNLFDSHEAMEVEQVLSSISSPENGRLLRAALVTDILGLEAEELQEVIVQERLWDEWVVRFRQYQNLWASRGFMRMFRQFLKEEKALPRLVRFPDGERRCTNLLHLGEVLHQVSLEKGLNGIGLIKWLSIRRSGAATDPEEHPIRLESDERAVKLVTVHKSKGLEYPVVFCPFGWGGSALRNSREPFTFHTGNAPFSLFLDLGSEHVEENRKKAEEEILSENLRLLYVSLTRAKACCYFVWGRFNEAETSAPAYLFYPPPTFNSENWIESTRETYRRLGNQFVKKLRELERRSAGSLSIGPLPAAGGELKSQGPKEGATHSCRTFRGHIDRSHGFASFSSLVGMQKGEAEPFDHDPVESTGPVLLEEEPQGFFSFPSGMRVGSFLHAVFESLEFTGEELEPMRGIVRENLLGYGLDPIWEDEVCRMVRRVLHAPLDPGLPGLRLSEIGPADRLHEVEFYWPLKRVTAERLSKILGEYGEEVSPEFAERVGSLEFSPLRGFMRGFMDLLFRFRCRYYLLDWKSNDLGNRVEGYGRKEMAEAMHKGNYVLQYLIYTVAVHQYLRLRVPNYRYESHFGGLFYIFLRGVAPDGGSDFGIFRERPSEALILRLAAELIEE